MPNDMTGRRRLLLGAAGATTLALLAPPARAEAAGPAPDVHIEMTAQADQIAILPGAPTRVWRYGARLLRGDPGALQTTDDALMGPVIRVRRGQRVRIELLNKLPESTVIHWHGLHVPEDMDGHPRFAIGPGERYVYAFTVNNRAGSYWFHAHPHGRTGKQVYFGLSGLFLVGDEEDSALGLPSGAYDLPLVLQDRRFDAQNQLVHLSKTIDAAAADARQDRGMMDGMGGMQSMMAAMMGVLGDQVLVNGRPAAEYAVERAPYRLRLCNASNTRTYKLAWSDGTPLTVIASDGGLLPAAVRRDYVMLAPAERIELWVDFAQWPADATPALRSLPFEAGMRMGGMMGSATLPDGAALTVLALRVGRNAARATTPPTALSRVPAADPAQAINAGRPKVFRLTMGMMRWGINGEPFDMLAASALETVRLGTQEVWEFRNDAAMGMAMAHAMHVHGMSFRVLGRAVERRAQDGYDSVRAGFVDDGWKDTVLVMPGERVRILVRFEDYTGLFLYHCHMLEHEDTGLMRNYRVTA